MYLSTTDDAPFEVSSAGDLTLESLLSFAASRNGSDLFLKVGTPPAIKVNGRIEPTTFPTLSEEDARRLAFERMDEAQRAAFHRDREMNLSFTVEGISRIRQNVYWQRDTVATTCRLIPLRVKSLADLNIDSKAINGFTEAHNGLVLVTGPTGSGKSTTLAAMIDYINSTRHANIITVEDPIEYVHPDKKSIISQREVGIDTVSFNEALKQVLRQTPDVILIGELRDLDTLNVALQAAETGHLVFATLHTSSAAETLDRISNMYQPHERAMLWLRISVTLRGVVSQKLVRRADGAGRAAAQEMMVVTPTISKQLEEGQSSDLYTAIRQDGQEGYWGMQTMNQHLERYVEEGVITEEEALLHAGNTAELKQMLRRSANNRLVPAA
jgi:twitching motility protein PilT